MRAVVQRVSSAQVTVDGQVAGAIGRGYLVLLGIGRDDTGADGGWMIRKLLNLRIFPDAQEKINLSIQDIQGALLVISQFTLYGDARKGNRPGFVESMPGPEAREFYAKWMTQLRAATTLQVAEGRFAAHMSVQLVNEGPFTILLDSRENSAPPPEALKN